MAEPTLEERVAALEAAVTALVEQDADDYSLRYSGEEVDEALDYKYALTQTAAEVNTVVGRDKSVVPGWTAAKLNQVLGNIENLTDGSHVNDATTRTYPLCIARGVITHEFAAASTVTYFQSWHLPDVIPDGIDSGYSVFVSDDGGGIYTDGWAVNDLSYTVSGRNLDILLRLYHNDSSAKSGTMKIYWMIIGTRSGGGVIN